MSGFLLWNHIERDEKSFGMIDIKPRRIGDTEKSKYLLWWRAIKWRDSNSGIQDRTEEHAHKLYMTITESNIRMPKFLRAVNRGSTQPQGGLYFTYPEEAVSKKKLQQEEEMVGDYEGIPPLNSKIEAMASKPDKFDGARLTTYLFDESGKSIQMDVNELWDIIKKCLSVYNGMVIIGKAILPTTVEEFEDGETVRRLKIMWDGSDPSKLNENGQTKTGLTRVFRDALINGQVDEWGFPDKEATLKFIKNEIKQLEDDKNFEAIDRLKRKAPLKVEDALKVPSIDCVLIPHRLDQQLAFLELDNPLYSDGTPWKNEVVRGHLVWNDRFTGHVKNGMPSVSFIPDPTGHWHISQQPTIPNNCYSKGGRWFPGNISDYSIGLDPTEMRMNEQDVKKADKMRHSKCGIAIYRKHNPLVDSPENGIITDENGEITNVDMMQTDKFVATWCHRPSNPYDAFIEVLKAAIYFGATVFGESDKTYIINKFHDTGFRNYLQFKSSALSNNPNKKRKSAQTAESGAKSTTNIIDLYTNALKVHIHRRISNNHHKELIEDWRKFKVTNRTFCDLSVASGFALLGAITVGNKREMTEKQKDSWEVKMDKYFADGITG